MNYVTALLIAISIVGAIGIPMGDPKFLITALSLEGAYISLAIISFKRLKYAIIPSIVIASIVIAGNTLSKTHLEIMLTLNPLQNAIVLIIGGYILQILLIVTSILYRDRRIMVRR